MNKIQDKVFRQSTSTFYLEVCLSSSQLNITLRDLHEQITYKGTYSSKDYGQQICTQVNLESIFNALSLYCYCSDQGRIKLQKSNQTNNYFIYKFGEVVKKDGNCCYKIQKNGKITVYVPMINVVTKHTLIVQSRLALTKISSIKGLKKFVFIVVLLAIIYSILSQDNSIDQRQLSVFNNLYNSQREYQPIKQLQCPKQQIKWMECPKQQAKPMECPKQQQKISKYKIKIEFPQFNTQNQEQLNKIWQFDLKMKIKYSKQIETLCIDNVFNESQKQQIRELYQPIIAPFKILVAQIYEQREQQIQQTKLEIQLLNQKMQYPHPQHHRNHHAHHGMFGQQKLERLQNRLSALQIQMQIFGQCRFYKYCCCLRCQAVMNGQ